MYINLLFLTFVVKHVYCRDFYMGMFKRNDYLVAQDSLYKGAVSFTYTYAKYGRIFKCPITYFRVVDRLGLGRGPTVQIVRGGLLKNYIVARIRSPYNLPISVNIYVGCENKNKGPVWKRPTRPTMKDTKHNATAAATTAGHKGVSETGSTAVGGNANTEAGNVEGTGATNRATGTSAVNSDATTGDGNVDGDGAGTATVSDVATTVG